MVARNEIKAAAKAAGLTRFFDGVPCRKGHVAERLTSTGGCSVCAKIKQDEWVKNNPKAVNEKSKRYQHSHVEVIREGNRRRGQRWTRNNPEKRRQLTEDWGKRNPSNRTFRSAKRRAVKRSATPIWANLDLVKSFYLEAERLTNETGVAHHVDHIFPLNGENSCGLHVETNLQVLPWKENLEKRNTMPLYYVEDGKLVILQSV